MIRDPELIGQLVDTISRFVRERLIPNGARLAYAGKMVGRVADRAVQVHGGAGYMSEYAAERCYHDVRLFRIYEGTTQIQQIVIARNMVWEAS